MINENEKRKLEKFFLFSNGDLHIYVGITKKEFPALYEEIRKISEREFKIEDAYDRFDETYKYLVCIARYEDPEELPLEKSYEIVSFYRYILCKDTFSQEAFSQDNSAFDLSTSNFYKYSSRFQTMLPATLELGRSVVNHESKMAKKGLEAVWKGLGALIDYYSKHENIKLLFGEVSLQKSRYHVGNIWEDDTLVPIISCFIKNFGHDDLIIPKRPCTSKNELLLVAKEMGFTGSFPKDSVMLRRLLKSQGTPSPQLFFHYANLVEQDGLSMYLPVNNELLNCWEMGLLLRIERMKPYCLKHFIPKNYNEQAFL